MSDSMLDLKKKMFKRIQLIFKKPKSGQFDDEWINRNLILQIKDNCPEMEVKGYMNTRKA
jgi:hypothetical protein